MLKISSINTICKTYLGRFFTSAKKSANQPVINATEEVFSEPQKVVSKQIEAYYKRYGKSLTKKQKPEKLENTIEQETQVSININIQEEQLAQIKEYNKRRFLGVSEEAIKGLEHNFEEKKQKVIKIILSDSECLSSEYISSVKKISTPEELSKVIRTYFINHNMGMNSKYKNDIIDIVNKKKMSLNMQQKIFKDEATECNMQLALIKAVTEPSKDKRVIQVEQFLKENYGMDYVHLESIEEAKNILKTVKMCIKHNIPLPKNIIISPFVMVQASGQNIAHSATEYSVFISSKKEQGKAIKEAYEKLVSPELDEIIQTLKNQDENWFSTKDFLHVYVHEFCHSDQALELLIPFKLKQIPKKYYETIKKIGLYAQSSRRELLTELQTKNILGTLNEDEKALLNYFV